MDPTGCSAGWATDAAFQRPAGLTTAAQTSPSPSPLTTMGGLATSYAPTAAAANDSLAAASDLCGSSLVAYWVVMGTLTAVRTAASAHRAWTAAHPVSRRRRPTADAALAALFSTTCVAYWGVVACVGANSCDAESGTSFVALGFAIVVPSYEYVALAHRLVRLGDRLIPSGVSAVPQPRQVALASYDSLAVVLAAAALVFETVAVVGFVVLTPADLARWSVWVSLAFAAQGAFQLSASANVLHQFNRLVAEIDDAAAHKRRLDPEFPLDRVLVVRRSMRQRQLSVAVWGLSPAVLFTLLGARALPWRWELVLFLSGFFETASSVMFEAFQNRRARRRRMRLELERMQRRSFLQLQDLQREKRASGEAVPATANPVAANELAALRDVAASA